MKLLSDRALMQMYDRAHTARVRTEQVETTESLTGELISNRVLFDTFGRLTTYALEHQLVLRCDYRLNGNASPRPEWTVLLGANVAESKHHGTAHFATRASAAGPILADVLREVAFDLGLIPVGSVTAGVH